ncbi:MAG: hypothetical protein UR85_C0011G0032 [Candidatus Nomurabacteria bacterium GW2011_GWF2_35_66]|nr:MAG: hypothetical protein UR85_C0011G0032 [Candidatus Nomurabacteria bacterium GW2011_GWF2_35_66]HBM45438.1 hypothetical protein [Patescibacteria group bacterium]
MKKAICLELEYFKGSAETVQGVDPCEQNHYDIDRGYFKNTGNGNGVYLVASKLVLVVFIKPDEAEETANICDHKREIYIDKFFKDRFGRLTKRNLELISKTMPTTVEVKKTFGRKGTEYYQVSEEDLNKWYIRCEEEKEKSKRKKK